MAELARDLGGIYAGGMRPIPLASRPHHPLTKRTTYKYKASPSRMNAVAATRQLSLCCELYNTALQERRDAYRLAGVSITRAMQSGSSPNSKNCAEPWRGRIPGSAGRPRAVGPFAPGVLPAGEGRPDTGFPRFRSARRYDSLTFKQAGWSLAPVSSSGKKRTFTLHGIGMNRPGIAGGSQS